MDKTSRHKLIWDFQNEIIKVYKENELTNLSGLNRDFILNDRNILKWYYDTINSEWKKDSNFDFHRCFEDLIFCSDEILYFTALIFFYKPFLHNPIEHAIPSSGKMIYPYTKTIEDSRFYIFANSLHEKVYNYWDRIGDLIAVYFPETFSNPKKIYFTTVIDNLPSKFVDSENYIWLRDFRNKQFGSLNAKRKDIVHYELLGTSFRWDHINNPTDKGAIEKLVNEREKLPEYFKEHIKLTQTGFEKTLQLIEEITK
ncbi:MAG: hypothetical protein GY834_01515 [Bacteroidetes bacterium]|nr:hypothetical protein [Bacteroidota bacterium]